MASRGLGSLTLDLIAKIGGFTGPLSKAERELQQSTRRMNKMANDFGRSIGSSLKSAAGAFLAFAGVTVSIGAIANSLKGAIDRADQLRDASIRLGVGVETLSAFGYAAQQTGTDVEALEKGLKQLSKAATEALNPKSKKAGLFEALGVSKDALTDLNKLVPQVADAFKQLPDGPQKAALAMQLFGKAGADLIEFLNQGGDGLQAFTERAKELGIVISQDTADAADEFNDKLGDLKAAGTGLATQVASELLPALSDLLDWATDFVSDGDNARSIADGMSEAFRGLADSIALVLKVGSGLGSLREALAGAEQSTRDVAFGLGAGGPIARSLKETFPFLYSPIIGGNKQAPKQGPAPTRLSTTTVVGNMAEFAKQEAARIKEQKALQDSINKYLGNPSGGGAKGGGKSKAKELSEEDKAAKQLKESYDRLVESYTEQTALVGAKTEAQQAYFDVTQGALSKLTEAEKQNVLALASGLDVARQRNELLETEAENRKKLEESVKEGIKSTDEMIKEMEFELSLITMTNAERERAIALRYADANATTEQKARIVELADAIRVTSENQEQIEGLKDSMKDFIVDAGDGVGSLKDAWDDFFDNLYRRALEFVANQAINALFDGLSGKGKTGSTASSGTGDTGFWAGLIGSFFGSGKAWGGNTRPFSINEVNERGFEMATVGGRDYMLTGASPVQITPNHRIGGGGDTFNFAFEAPTSTRTQAQLAGRVQFALQRNQRNR